MPPTARSEARAFGLGLLGVALVTLWRLALLPFDRADLFVDDAQYWFWGQALDWGYYSKPPLIGWIIRLSTSLGSGRRMKKGASLPTEVESRRIQAISGGLE